MHFLTPSIINMSEGGFQNILISQQAWCAAPCPAASLTIASGKVY